MQVKPLSSSSFDAIIDCFLSAFEGYFVPMPQDKAYYQARWAAAKVDFDLSFGMYDKDMLVGFIVHAIDNRNGRLTAYNTGTGVIPSYRRQKIVQQIYTHAIPVLKKNGITFSTLEVICENSPALNVYKDVGFNVTRHYKCYKGNILVEPLSKPELRKLEVEDILEKISDKQIDYSWDFHINSIRETDFSCYVVLENGEMESYFIIREENSYLLQFDVLGNSETAWDNLTAGIRSITDTLKVNNIDTRFAEKMRCIEKLGVKYVVDQYEMEMHF